MKRTIFTLKTMVSAMLAAQGRGHDRIPLAAYAQEQEKTLLTGVLCRMTVNPALHGVMLVINTTPEPPHPAYITSLDIVGKHLKTLEIMNERRRHALLREDLEDCLRNFARRIAYAMAEDRRTSCYTRRASESSRRLTIATPRTEWQQSDPASPGSPSNDHA